MSIESKREYHREVRNWTVQNFEKTGANTAHLLSNAGLNYLRTAFYAVVTGGDGKLIQMADIEHIRQQHQLIKQGGEAADALIRRIANTLHAMEGSGVGPIMIDKVEAFVRWNMTKEHGIQVI